MAEPAQVSLIDPGVATKKHRAFKAIWPYMRPYRWSVLGAALALVFTVSVTLSIPIAARLVVDGYRGSDAAQINQYFLMALGLIVLFTIGSSLRIYLVKLTGERTVADLRKTVFARMIRMSPGFFDRMMTGEVLSRITTDTTLILSAIGWWVSIAFRNVLMLTGSFIMMFMTSGKLTLLVIVVIPLMLGPIAALGRKLRGHSRDSQERIAASSGAASELLIAAPEVQAYTHEARSASEFGAIIAQALAAAKRLIRTQALMQCTALVLAFMALLGVLWIGASDVVAGTMSKGQLVQFVICAMLAAEAAGGLSSAWAEIQRAVGASERLFELVEAEDAVQDPEAPIAPASLGAGVVTFDNVTFSYPSRPGTPALDGVSFEIAAGETVALVGPSGAGKSTVLQLLQRFYDPDGGKVCLDGVDLRDMDRSAFRKCIGVVQQDPVIFASSARENIRFGRPHANDEEVEAAARASAAHVFLSKLPDGYDTFLGERGVMLSGGQKQRIAIARAILRDAPVLLLDEATSALDAESEKAVHAAFEALSADRTTLVIAHRLATVKQADRILVFEAGRLVAEGTHETLVAENGLYARFAQLQFADDITAG